MEQNQIHFRAEFSIEDEPYTINYQFYLNKDQTKCLVHETYEDSDAALAHGNGVASRTILPRIFTLAKISRFDVYGNPNVELQKSLASFGAETFNLFTGFSR